MKNRSEVYHSVSFCTTKYYLRYHELVSLRNRCDQQTKLTFIMILLMSKWKRYTIYTVTTLVILIVASVGYLTVKPAQTWPVQPREVVDKREALARGKYLVENVAHCQHCHSPMHGNLYAFPTKPDSLFSGTYLMGRAQGLPGEFYTANLTPHNLAKYADEELFRALTQGVAKDGHVMFPMMPYMAYGTMDPNDVWAMIDYLRTLKPIKADHPASVIDFPVSLLVKLGQPAPKPVSLEALKTEAQQGGYLVTIAGCIECHSPENEKHEPDMTLAGAGGRKFILPDNSTLVTPNITPHADGLGNWSADRFVARFKQYQDTTYKPHEVKPGEKNTYMAWHYFSRMDERDLRSIYAYLKTLPAKAGQHVVFTPATAQAKASF